MNDHTEAMGTASYCPIMPTYAPPTLQLVSGRGSYVTDAGGDRYLDLLSGLAVTSLGHSHPEVADALAAQARRLVHVSNLFGTEHQGPVARHLDRLLGGNGQVFFANSGAEANECAFKLARKHGGHGRHNILSAYGSFHGRTLATLHATGQPSKHEAFQPLPEGFRHAEWNDLDAFEAAIDDTTAAVMIEIVQGEGGVNVAAPHFIKGLRRITRERGILLIVDEVQTGLGRCGEWFAHQAYDVVPDVVTMAKALGNGVPIGACWADRGVAGVFEPGDHATTYGGQPLATAAARRVLEVMEREDVARRAKVMGNELRARLSTVPGVANVRGMGLLLAVQLDSPNAAQVAAALLEARVIVNAVAPDALRLAPSLLITDDEMHAGVDAIRVAIASVADEGGT